MNSRVRAPRRATTADVIARLSARSPEFAAAVEERELALRFAQTVRELRESAGVSQTELAALAGMSQAQISVLESGGGAQGPTTSTVVRVGRALGVEFELHAVPLKENR